MVAVAVETPVRYSTQKQYARRLFKEEGVKMIVETIADPITEELEREGVAFRTHDQLPEWLYHGRPEWSKSQFGLLPEEPELFYGRHILKLPDWQLEESPQMRLGTAVHEAVLLKQDVKIIPADVLSKSGSRAGAAWKQFEEEHAGEVWLRESEADPVKRAVEAVRKRKFARRLLEAEGESELSIFWKDELTNLPLRGRIDRLCKIGSGIVLDLKTANDPTSAGFPWKCLDLKYDVQAATYMYGATQVFGVVPDCVVFIAVEVSPPYRCRIHEASQDDLLTPGYIKMKEALLDLQFRLESNNWETADAESVHTLRLPKPKTGRTF
jgi:RecB family exonuclease